MERLGRRLTQDALKDRGISPEELKIIEQEIQDAIDSKEKEQVPSAPILREDGEVVKEDNLMQKWDKQMADFVPEKMFTMDIVGKTDEVKDFA